VLVAMAGVLDQFALGLLKSLGLALPRFLQGPLRLIHGIGVLGRGTATDPGGFCSRRLFLLAL
jgi:hypothetical protein